MENAEIWMTPLIMLPGVALLVMSTSARFSGLHAEVHRFEEGADPHRLCMVRHLCRRAGLFRNALVALYTSVGLLAGGSLLGGILSLTAPNQARVTLLLFTGLGIFCLLFAAVQLIRESSLSLREIQEHEKALDQSAG